MQRELFAGARQIVIFCSERQKELFQRQTELSHAGRQKERSCAQRQNELLGGERKDISITILYVIIILITDDAIIDINCSPEHH